MPGGETPTSLSYQGNIVIPTAVTATGTTGATPAAGTTVASAALVPGEYTISWTVGLSGTPGNADRNNFGLYQGSTLIATSANSQAVNDYIQSPVVVVLTANTTIAVKVIATPTTGAVYDANINAVPVSVVAPDDPLYPYNPLTADGNSVNITSTPANLAVTIQGVDLSAQAECQVFRGTNVPSGTSDFGPVDTTYLPTQAQQLQGMQACQF